MKVMKNKTIDLPVVLEKFDFPDLQKEKHSNYNNYSPSKKIESSKKL